MKRTGAVSWDYSPYRVGGGRGNAVAVEKSSQGGRACGNPGSIGEESGCGNQRKGEF